MLKEFPASSGARLRRQKSQAYCLGPRPALSSLPCRTSSDGPETGLLSPLLSLKEGATLASNKGFLPNVP